MIDSPLADQADSDRLSAMRTDWLNVSISCWMALALLLAVVSCAAGCSGDSKHSAVPAKSVPLLGPAPAISQVEKQWAKSWIETVEGVAAPGKVHVECLAQGWAAMQWNQNMQSVPLTLGKKAYASGFGTHANSDICVQTAVPARHLKVVAGVDDNGATSSSFAAPVGFSIVVRDKTVWSCPPRSSSQGAIEADVDLGGATEFHLIAKTVGESIRFAHADWCQPMLTLADGTTVDISRRSEFPGVPAQAPFSFRSDGKSSSELLPTWQVTRDRHAEPDGITVHRTTYKDPKTQLECVMELREYPDFPAARWVIRFRNAGSSNTPILEDIQALDSSWATGAQPSLFYSKGSEGQADDFQTISSAIPSMGEDMPSKPLVLGSVGGRPTSKYLPFFNVQDDKRGVMIGLGWTGQWSASFVRDLTGSTHIQAGMEKTHLVLHPGEEIRTPSVLMIFWQGEAIRGNNLLRQFILHRVAPRPNGQIIQAPLALGAWGGDLTSSQIETIRRQTKAGLSFDIFWVDAGWYGDSGGKPMPELTGHWAGQVGNWNINRGIHPDGFVQVSKAARDAGMGMLLWVEPERAIWGSQITRDHPEWFLGRKSDGASVLLNLGDPQARQWATDLISGMVKDLNLAWYRQDFNMNCLEQWRSNDAPDRQGMTEIRHVEGLYTFWDELLRRNPGLMIDNCASGGRRLDLELLSRSIPLWRTDYHCPGREHDPMAGQVHTMGLSYWLPLSGTSAWAEPPDSYTFRSNLTAAIGFGGPGDVATNASARQWCQNMIQQYRQARPFFYGDYYPLTRTSTSPDTWAAYQFHRPDLDAGLVVLLRRVESPFPSAQLKLNGLDASTKYEFIDADSGTKVMHSGQEAMTTGVAWTLDKPRTSRLVFYRKVR